MATLSLCVSPSAFAGGKATGSCAAGGWTLAQYVTETGAPAEAVAGDLINVSDGSIVSRNHDGLGYFAQQGIDVIAIFKAVDNNGDGLLCYKLPSGWDTAPPSNKTYFLSLGDNKP